MFPTVITAKVKPRLTVTRNVNVISRASHVCRKLVAFCLVLFAPGNCRGTIVVLINNGDNIWIGTDSLQSNAAKTMTRLACKINKERTFYWVVATPILADVATGFDFGKVVSRTHLRGTLKHKMRKFIDKSKVPLSGELATIKKTSPDFFANMLTYKALFSVLFVGIEAGHPRFTWAVLNAQESKKGKVEIVSQGPETITSKSGFFSMGEAEAAKVHISAHIGDLTDDPVGLIRDSIAAQESAEPDMVGGPISIAKIGPIGLTWIQKGECQ